MPDPKIEQFKKVLKIDPNDETLWFGLGKAYMGEENWTGSHLSLGKLYSSQINLLCRDICAGSVASEK